MLPLSAENIPPLLRGHWGVHQRIIRITRRCGVLEGLLQDSSRAAEGLCAEICQQRDCTAAAEAAAARKLQALEQRAAGAEAAAAQLQAAAQQTAAEAEAAVNKLQGALEGRTQEAKVWCAVPYEAAGKTDFAASCHEIFVYFN